MNTCDDIKGLTEEYRILFKKPASKMSVPSKFSIVTYKSF